MINIDAILFPDDFIKLILGSECLHAFPGWTMLFKASEINIKPAHNSVCVGRGRCSKSDDFELHFRLGQNKVETRKSLQEAMQKIVTRAKAETLTAPVPILAPGSLEQSWQMSPSYPRVHPAAFATLP